MLTYTFNQLIPSGFTAEASTCGSVEGESVSARGDNERMGNEPSEGGGEP